MWRSQGSTPPPSRSSCRVRGERFLYIQKGVVDWFFFWGRAGGVAGGFIGAKWLKKYPQMAAPDLWRLQDATVQLGWILK